MNRYDYLRNSHDLSLSDWGPYARDVYGLSHIADHERGIKFDFFMVPGLLRRAFFMPETLRECDCSPWEAAPDLSYFSVRQQMEGRNLFYTDTAYCRIAEDLYLGRIEFVNHTAELRGASLLLYTRLAPRDQVAPVLPPDARWIDALDYKEMAFSYPRADHNLTWGAGRRGEQSYPGTVGSRCLGQPFYDRTLPCFGARTGDRVEYEFAAGPTDGKILLRARVDSGQTVKMCVAVNGLSREFSFTGTGAFELFEIHTGKLSGPTTLELAAMEDGCGIRIDGLVVLPELTPNCAVGFAPIGRAVNPVSAPGAMENSTVFTGADLKKAYLSWWSRPASTEREYWVRDLPRLINYSYGLRQPYYNHWDDNQGDEFCHDSYIIPIEVPAEGRQVVYALYAAGSDAAAVNAMLGALDRSSEALERLYETARTRAVSCPETAEGAPFRFSRQLMAATSLTNVNFPIQARGKNIRHHVPDKYFNSLYSWDSGFIGLGFLELDRRRAIENLNVYVTEPDDDENAFVLYGTPLPVQAYLYAEIWNRHQDRDMLEFFYPRLRHFYDFIAGHIPSSTYRTAKTDLLRSWDYFYNSAGWDDYPPQWYIYKEKRYDVAPVATTAHAIRFARILAQAARTLGKNGDLEIYEADIKAMGEALQRYSWDENEQVFSYIEHDADGHFRGIFRDPASGRNFNLGMDGVTPLVAGVCTNRQRDLLFDRLSSPQAMWTPIGISTVDQQAPYYRTDGYWNGCVWMPHQWFFWKAALDANRADFARRIADTALKLWKNEVDQSFYCLEHFSITSRRGAGCCHFGGLSSPVLNWYGAYYIPGRLTGGFDTWIAGQKQSGNEFTAELEIAGNADDLATLLYVAEDDGPYAAIYNDIAVPCAASLGKCLEITLPKHSAGTLRMIRK